MIALWLFVVLASVGVGIPACTADDKDYVFAPCSDDGLMMSVEYFTRLCELEPPMAVNPPRATPCVMSCQSGEWYSPRTIDCQPCPAGKYSNSGGLLIADFTQFPSELTTFCSPAPCSPWRVSPGLRSLDSGNQSGHQYYFGFVDESVEVSLLTVAHVINTRPGAGKLIFEYRVESERGFDGLVLYLNDTHTPNPDATVGEGHFWATGVHYHWRRAEVPLPLGKTIVRLVYEKDINQGQVFTGDDKAFLRNIVVEGVRLFAPACRQCPPGTFANASGSLACHECPRNTHSAAGSSYCRSCTAGERASPASAVCEAIPTCTPEDYVAEYSNCNGGTRTRRWRLPHSGACVAKSTPQTSTVPCAPCLEGSYEGTSGDCEKCEQGLAFVGGRCSLCAPGTAAVPVLSFMDGFDRFGTTVPAIFSMLCDGMCSGCSNDQPTCKAAGGFELASFPSFDDDRTAVGIRQSPDGDFFTSTLEFHFEMVSAGSLAFSYMFYRHVLSQPMPSELTAFFEIDGIPERLDRYHVGIRLNDTVNRRLGAGRHNFKLTVIKAGAVPSDVAVVLLGIEVVGDSRGSASQCRACPAGHYCPGGGREFMPCEPGTAQMLEGTTECRMCGPGEVAKEPASYRCATCAVGTQAQPNRRLCTSTCDFSINSNRYDLSALSAQVFGPVYASYRNTTDAHADEANVQRFFFSPCTFANAAKRAEVCPLHYGSVVEDAYACQRINGNRSYSIGDDMAYGIEGSQLKMFLTGGDVCRVEGGRARSSTVSFVCNRDISPGNLQFTSESPMCHYNFVFTSVHACPLCLPVSYSRVVAECANNSRRVTYFRTEEAASCSGGYVPPPNAYVSCLNCNASMYDLVWSSCEGNQRYPNYVLRKEFEHCYEMDPPQFDLFPESCRTINATVGVNPFTLTVVIVVLVVGLLVAGLYLLFRRHSDLQHRYERLSTAQGGRELTPITESCNTPAAAIAEVDDASTHPTTGSAGTTEA